MAGISRVRLLAEDRTDFDSILDKVEQLLGSRPRLLEPIPGSLDSAGEVARFIADIVDIPATVAGASAVLSRLAGLLQSWIDADSRRVVEIVQRDGSRVRVEGHSARLEDVLRHIHIEPEANGGGATE